MTSKGDSSIANVAGARELDAVLCSFDGNFETSEQDDTYLAADVTIPDSDNAIKSLQIL